MIQSFYEVMLLASDKCMRCHGFQGNLFSCSDLPDRDPEANHYVCGSLALDQSLIVLTSVLGFMLLLASYAHYFSISSSADREISQDGLLLNHFKELWTYYNLLKYWSDSIFPNLRGFNSLLVRLVKASVVFAIVGTFLCLPVYVLKFTGSGGDSSEYSTHDDTYRWTITVAYITGILPSSLLLGKRNCTLCCVICV